MSLFLVAPTFAGGAGPVGLFRFGKDGKAPEPAVSPVPAQQAPGGAEAQQPADVGSDPRKMLDRPLDSAPPEPAVPTAEVPPDFVYPIYPTLGFAGRSSVEPRSGPTPDFVPMEDRWRIGFPEWDRYDRGHQFLDDYPGERGCILDPFQQNVLKGDYPVMGQNTFMEITASTLLLVDGRQTPVGTGAFESTANPFQEEFFGSPNQVFYSQFFTFAFDLNHGDAAFKQSDWRIHISPVFDVNSINAEELAFVNPNVLKGTQRNRSFLALQEYFGEIKLADTSPHYDIASLRVGSQFFNNDFRGFLFADTNRAVRLFGTANSNQTQYNLVYFRQAEKDSNSALNTLDDRRQNIFFANIFHQDFIWPGYEVTASVVYNNDPAQRKFDTNSVRVRPDNAGTFQPHSLDVVYFGLGSNGHVDRYNLTTQLYYAIGRDSQNPIANTGQDIRAGMAAAELSYDRDWARFRTSFFWSSGDSNPNNRHAGGFDAIFDNPNFAGGGFSYWQRQGIGLFGVNLVNRESLIPDLKSSKIQGQSNFVNPGLLLFNLGLDADITPTLTAIFNTNFLWFQSTEVLKTFLFDGNIAHFIGTDISLGFEYRPLASNNIVMTFGVSMLIPGDGFQALFDNKVDTVDPLLAAFLQTVLLF
ncbi:MAG TPA: hypothetical protein VKD72_27670 [Gemmataceae bacterium]|nr:hypothetical protein [Gemmataceae bacterium]